MVEVEWLSELVSGFQGAGVDQVRDYTVVFDVWIQVKGRDSTCAQLRMTSSDESLRRIAKLPHFVILPTPPMFTHHYPGNNCVDQL